MSYRKKILAAVLFSFSAIGLSGCSVAGIKVIERASMEVPPNPNDEDLEEKQGQAEEETKNVRTFKHAGYVFREVNKTLYTKESTPAMDSLDDKGSIVRSLVPGESIKVIGIDAGKEYAVFQDGKDYLYVSMDSLTDEKEETEKPTKGDIINKEELESVIKECKEMLKSQSEYNQDTVAVLQKELVEAEKIFQNVDVKQTEVDAAINSLMKAKRELTKEVENKEPKEPNNEEPAEVKTEVIKEKIQEYEDVLKEDKTEYTEESIKAYDEAMAKMKALLDKETVSAEEVKKITMELDRAIAGLKLKKEVDNQTQPVTPPATPEGLGIAYPSAPDSVDIYGGVTFAILKDVTATVAIDGKVYELSSAESKETGAVKVGEKVKVLAIGTNDFARIEYNNGKVGFIKSTYLKKN